MQAIMREAGPDTGAKAIVFTVPAGSYKKGIRAVLKSSGGSTMTLSFFTTGDTIGAKVCAFPSTTFQAGKEIIFNETDPMGGEDMDLEETAGTAEMGAEGASAAVSITVGSYNIWATTLRSLRSAPGPTATRPLPT